MLGFDSRIRNQVELKKEFESKESEPEIGVRYARLKSGPAIETGGHPVNGQDSTLALVF